MLIYFSEETTESMQMIDAVRVRSTRYRVGRVLDDWIMKEEYMEKWESKVTASERIALTNHLVANGNDESLNKNALCEYFLSTQVG